MASNVNGMDAREGPDAPPGDGDPSHPLRLELEKIGESGARAFDEPAYRFIDALLIRAEKLGGEVGSRLRARASERLAQLEDDFISARDSVSHDLLELEANGVELEPALRRAYESGHLRRAQRKARRRLARIEAHRRRTSRDIVDRIAEKARARGLTPPPPMPEVPLLALPAPRPVPEEIFRLSELLYRQAYESSSARHAVANALDGLPKVAGRYHSTTIAARTLAEMESLSFPYLAAQLRRLTLYGALRAFATPLEAPPKKKHGKN